MKKLIILIVVLFAFSNANAEKIVVSGKVLLNNQFALGNVIVTAKKSKATVSTNVDGEYSIACEKKDVLIFKAKLFGTVKKSVRGRSTIDVNMKAKNKIEDVEKMVDLGYVKTENLSAVKKLFEDKNGYSKYVSIEELIRSKFPFVDSKGDGVYILRGMKSITSEGSSAALLDLDGSFVNDFSNVQPHQVKSIKVYQGSEAVRYGSRGANGVIKIITKKK